MGVQYGQGAIKGIILRQAAAIHQEVSIARQCQCSVPGSWRGSLPVHERGVLPPLHRLNGERIHLHPASSEDPAPSSEMASRQPVSTFCFLCIATPSSALSAKFVTFHNVQLNLSF